MRGPTSVRARLTLGNMAALALVLFGFVTVIHFSVHALLMASVDRDLEREANQAAAPSRRFAAFQEPPPQTPAYAINMPAPLAPMPTPQGQPDMLWLHFTEQRRGMGLGIFEPNGKRLPLPPPMQDDPIWNRPHDFPAPDTRELFTQAAAGKTIYHTFDTGKQTLRICFKPILQNGKVNAIVQVAYPMGELQNLFRGLHLVLFGSIPFVLLATGISGAAMTHRALRPVRQITQAAAALEATDLSRRLPVEGKDEFAGLALTFNGLFGRLETAFTRLKESVELQRRFVADASHELRTPLTTIKANTSWALRRERTVAEYQEAMREMDAAAGRMDRLIEDLLRLARADSGQLTLDRRTVQIRQVLQSAQEAVVCRKPEVSVGIEVAEEDLTLCGDPHHLERLFVNLLDNALRHTPPGGTITMRARGENEDVVVTVADTGEGIPPEHLPYVCERFYRVDSARARSDGGTGLGLAICKSIAEAHGGTLEIASLPGQGTTVTVRLPQTAQRPFRQDERD